jgi:hypothetical protein
MFVAQSIRQPEQFYYAHTLSSAKRWKMRRSADNAVAQYPDSHFEELAIRAWNCYQQQRLQEAVS